jgi:hypothetical protein
MKHLILMWAGPQVQLQVGGMGLQVFETGQPVDNHMCDSYTHTVPPYITPMDTVYLPHLQIF